MLESTNENEIRHKNIIYCRDISELGGVETYVYQLAKKYKDLDIAVVYKSIHPNQLKRLSKICYTYKHTNQKIICDVAIINYDSSIIDYITPEIWKDNLKEKDPRGIYQGVHADYTNPAYTVIPQDKRVKCYLCITKHILKTYPKLIGADNAMLCYNPLIVEDEPKPLVLVSATRLSVVKGKNRMIELAKELDRREINYIWYVFTEDRNAIDSPNVIFMNPRLDVYKWITQADYVVQLSDTEACSYTINESLYRNIPIIVTPLPYLTEIGYKDGINGYTLEFDCSNVKEVADKILDIPKFEFKPLKDKYDKIFIKSKSDYYDKYLKAVDCQVIFENGYKDLYLNKWVKNNEILKNIPINRAKDLEKCGLAVIINESRD